MIAGRAARRRGGPPAGKVDSEQSPAGAQPGRRLSCKPGPRRLGGLGFSKMIIGRAKPAPAGKRRPARCGGTREAAERPSLVTE